jgi:hypothetical protein
MKGHEVTAVLGGPPEVMGPSGISHTFHFSIHIHLVCTEPFYRVPSKLNRGRAKNYFFSLFTSSQNVLDPTQPPIQRIPRGSFPGVKRPVREADYLHPTDTEIKDA